LPEAGAGVLITRPEPGASETAACVAELGLQPVISSMLAIRTLRAVLPPAGHVQAILAASANAIPALPQSHRQLRLLAVGEATAARAREAGFAHVSSADGDAAALAALAATICDPAGLPLLLATGRDQGNALAADLRGRRFRVVRRVVYAAVPVPTLSASAQGALADRTLTAVLFFSAETARQFVRLLRRTRLQEAVRAMDALAIGEAAAVALQALPWRRIRVATRPTQDAMLALLR
jgi:uroporphyrinogen-III synthase